MPLSAYKHFKSDGSIPDDLLPSDEAQFRYAFELDIDFTEQDLDSASKTQTVGVKLEFHDAGGALLLAWGFELRYRIAYLLIDVGFGIALSFFTWYVEKQTVAITAPDPPPATLGSPDGISEPGGGSDYTDRTGIIQLNFESPIFKVAFPKGSTGKVKFHSAGFPHLAAISSLEIRTRLGGAAWASGFRHPEDGEAIVVYSGKSDAMQTRALDRVPLLSTPQALTWKPDTVGFILRGPLGSRQVGLYGLKSNTVTRLSTDDGKTYGAAMTIYSGYTPLGAVRQEDGGIIILMSNKAGKPFVGYGDRNGHWADPLAVTLPPSVTKLSAPGVLLGESGGVIDFVYPDDKAATGVNLLRSLDDGRTWL